ncbi:hypothetical protein EX30DRAFT_123994 [Ascodesmis nigricans]|uniref:Secreted protein n=1 Tax=Ascodesmis nigricans TaxID=341454 RepID=A0A4S2MP00_9PEZI|nr:hypothetical protein EX30DRAFT_123994 [Ascodesmis nigricans]
MVEPSVTSFLKGLAILVSASAAVWDPRSCPTSDRLRDWRLGEKLFGKPDNAFSSQYSAQSLPPFSAPVDHRHLGSNQEETLPVPRPLLLLLLLLSLVSTSPRHVAHSPLLPSAAIRSPTRFAEPHDHPLAKNCHLQLQLCRFVRLPRSLSFRHLVTILFYFHHLSIINSIVITPFPSFPP